MAQLSWSNVRRLLRKLGAHDLLSWWPGRRKCEKEKANAVVNLNLGLRGYSAALTSEQICTELTHHALFTMGNGPWGHWIQIQILSTISSMTMGNSTFLGLSFSMCKMGLIIPSSKECLED